ncbi:MAG: cytidine deaminase [Erysipelotrichaceae bacterium]|jgi:cytidine deaminase|nr:cytidine deaminase [Erysipelotrichaceae bacterium]
MSNEELIRLAFEAREAAYAPYSNWKVGAALLCKNGKIYKGCNIENSGFSATVCAERTAFFKAVSEGEYDFEKIAIVAGDAQRGSEGYCTPCGVCRQVMSEFCKPDEFRIICAKSENEYHEFTLREMLPECNYIVEENDGYGFKV